MNFYHSTYLFAAILLAIGIPFLLFTNFFEKYAFAFLRSMKAAIITFGGGGLWFLYILSQLGEADFGNIKEILIAIFGIAGLLAFFYLNDFLSVRGAAILGLLLSREFLDSIHMDDSSARLVMATLSYVVVLASLYFGAVPYRLRDFFTYLYEKQFRAEIFGLCLCLGASALIIASFTY